MICEHCLLAADGARGHGVRARLSRWSAGAVVWTAMPGEVGLVSIVQAVIQPGIHVAWVRLWRLTVGISRRSRP